MKLSAILLAAGSSLRFGEQNKLLVDIGGIKLLRKTFECLQNSDVTEIIVVTGPDAEKIQETLAECTFRQIHNPNHFEGMGTSISCGVSGLSASTDAVFIVPGDMPEISSDVLKQLAKVFDENKGEKIICPQAPDGSQRNPVLWPKSFFSELAALRGPSGGKDILAENSKKTIFVRIPQDIPFLDIDTQEDLNAYRSRIP